jgi:hypothetical protein
MRDLFDCAKEAVANVVSAAVPPAWDAVCKSFAEAAAQLLEAFGKAFASLPDLSLASAGITRTYGICLVIAGTIAVLLIFGQVIRTAWTHDGSGLAQGVTGLGKAIVAWLLTAAVATAALAAADEITAFVVTRTFGSQQALAVRLGEIVNWAEVTGDPGQVLAGGSLLLVFALAGIVLVVVLWFELLLRNAAVAVLIAMSPIAAAGQVSETTKAWWLRTVSATVQLIILKPVIALVFAVGFGMAGTSSGIESLLAGLLVLALAVFCWPVIARFFTFATIQASSSGLAAVLGYGAGRAAGAAGGGQPAGADPSRWSLAAEQRTMAARGGQADVAGGGQTGAGPSAGPGGAGTLPGAAGASPGAGGAGSGGGAAVLAGIGWALGKANQLGATLAGRMEQTAAHAGMHGAYPYSTVSGAQRPGAGASRQHPPAGTLPGGQPPPAQPWETPPEPPAPPPVPEAPMTPGAPPSAEDESSEGDQ